MKRTIQNNLFIALVALLLFNNFSCKSSSPKLDPNDVVVSEVFGKMESIDLTDNGILLNIQAPEGALVRFYEQALEKAVTVEKGKYSIIVDQYSEYADESQDTRTVKDYRLTKTKERKDFSKVIYEDDSSYAFETEDPDIGTDYHFFYVFFSTDSIEYNFSDGFSSSNYTKEEALGMLQSVRQ